MPGRRNHSEENPAGKWLMAAGMLCLGCYGFAFPHALLADRFWDRLPDRTTFGYAIGAIFLGGGILFLLDALSARGLANGPLRLGTMIGSFSLTCGFLYVFWVCFSD